jgi:anti-sigma factor RsiW
MRLWKREALTCSELVELVTDYLDGALSRGDRARFEAHLEDCHGCNRYLEEFRETIRVAGTLREDRLDPVAVQTLLAHFRDWKGG